MHGSIKDDVKVQVQIMVHEDTCHYQYTWLGYIMEHLDETNYCLFLTEFGQRCEDCFVQDWHASLENNLHRRHGGRNKLRTYGRFKHSFEWETYLTYIKSPPLRTALCR